jgi:hypothetical protein
VTDSATLEWTVHLARRRLCRTAVVVIVIVIGSLAAGYGFRSPLLGLLAAVLLTGSLSDYLFPLRFILGPEAAEVRGLILRRRMSWPQVRRIMRDALGVKLSPLARRSRLEASRGIYLWFADNEDKVMATIAYHMGAEAACGDDLPSV